MLICDFHVHTNISRDAQSPIEEYAAAFDSGACALIGLTEHIDFHPNCGSYGYVDFARYRETVRSFQRAGYNMLYAAEIDYVPSCSGEIRQHLQAYDYAYTIGSVHMIGGQSISSGALAACPPDGPELLALMRGYHEAMVDMINSGLFDVVGHVGIYRRYLYDIIRRAGLWDYALQSDAELAGLCAQSGVIVEINTSGLFSPYGEMLPDEIFIKTFLEAGGTRLTVGSDAHKSAHLCRGFDRVAQCLKSLGVMSVINPTNGEEIRIN